MSRSKIYGALSFIAVLHDGSGFLGPALQGGGDKSPATSGRGLRTCGGVKRASCSNLGLALSRTSLVRNERGGVVMMAKKRRRRRVDGAKPAPASASPGSKDDQPGAAQDEDGDGEAGVALPPMPSELGRGAVMAAQKLQGEDMLSPAVFQPKPEVSDLEMVEGGGRSKYRGFDLDVELPMESESRETGKSGLGSVMSPDGVMPLPDFKDLALKPRKKERQKKATEVEEANKVERGNMAAFTKLLELDPEADSEDALFTTESYDAFSSILGEGKPFVGIDNSYLQSGHTVLLALVLVCAFIDLPGFPLTSLPYDLREFLKTGMLVVYAINSAIAYLSYLEAKRVGQPAVFWTFKGFVLGGLSFNELSQIEPRKIKPAKGGRERRG